MTRTVSSANVPGMPPNRHELRREALLATIGPTARPHRHRTATRVTAVVAACAVFLALAAAGLAITHYDFLGNQSRLDATMWEPPPLHRIGPRVEVARGADWAFMAWKSERGVCVAYATVGASNWSRGCGRGPGTPPDGPHALRSVLFYGLASGFRNEQGALYGVVEPTVSRVAFELADGSVVDAPTMPAPNLDTVARFFVIRRAFVIPRVGAPVRAVESYATDGAVIERAEVAPGPQ